MSNRPHAHRLRTGRVSEAGRGYLLTTVTCDRHPVFRDFSLARLAIHQLRACDESGFCTTLSFVLMPDHLHWLVQLHDGTLGGLMRRFKSCSAMQINRTRNTPGATLWQAGYHDHAIRDGEDIRALARYIVANPVRAGLVDAAGNYPHWDAAWL